MEDIDCMLISPHGAAADPNDPFLLAMSLDSDVHYLVTGDRRVGLLQLGRFDRTRIITPGVICTEIL